MVSIWWRLWHLTSHRPEKALIIIGISKSLCCWLLVLRFPPHLHGKYNEMLFTNGLLMQVWSHTDYNRNYSRYLLPSSHPIQHKSSLLEKCPNTEFFLVRIFPYSDWMRRETPYLFVFSLNTRKYGPEKTPYLDTFHAVPCSRCWI